ncbi:MAG TPA: alpha/beta hydrolase, partial [Alphaproteobacteria bacterium]|nr:alpha/beta hydrolase [Alphaproteobacteria bacterium]
NKSPNAPIALVLHPHPQHGGTMNNRVVYTLFQSFVAAGFSTLRINFRGVGRSQGKYDRGEGEMNDAASAVDWLQTYNPQASAIWIAGFSFGAWIGMQLLMRRPEFDGFVVVSPPANLYDFTFLAPCPSSGLIIQGDKDDLVSEPAVAKLAEKISKQRGLAIDYRVVPGANHFFADQQDIIAEHITGYLKKSLAGKAAQPAG